MENTAMALGLPARILLLEDDDLFAGLVLEALEDLGHTTTRARTVAEAFEELRKTEFQVAVLDLDLPDGTGMDVLKLLSTDDLPTEAIMLTGRGDEASAVQAMKLGAYDYLKKPAPMEEFGVLVAKAAEKAQLRRDNAAMRLRLRRDEGVRGFVTQDPALRDLFATLERAAPSDLPILIQGESGTGKELIARATHQKSGRNAHPYVAINCGALSDTLLESELFGHEKGAFTGALERRPGLFEAADRGTLFLDEVGDVSPALQVKLLRAIETKEFFRVGGTRMVRVDVRVVSASHKNLKAELQAGRFREDLYYRLNGVTLVLPPLRDRRGDIPLLADHFLRQSGSTKALTPAALDRLRNYSWPGNVRELQMVIQRAAILSRSDAITDDDLPADLRQGWKGMPVKGQLTLAELEKQYIETVLEESQGHRGKAAKILGIDPKTLYNKLRRDPSEDDPSDE